MTMAEALLADDYLEGDVEGEEGDLRIVRELARQAYADAIPELIDGGSVTEIMSSVEGARVAYARVFAEVQSRQGEERARPPVVPAGGSGPAVVDVDRLPVSEKLRLGVGAARR